MSGYARLLTSGVGYNYARKIFMKFSEHNLLYAVDNIFLFFYTYTETLGGNTYHGAENTYAKCAGV